MISREIWLLNDGQRFIWQNRLHEVRGFYRDENDYVKAVQAVEIIGSLEISHDFNPGCIVELVNT